MSYYENRQFGAATGNSQSPQQFPQGGYSNFPQGQQSQPAQQQPFSSAFPQTSGFQQQGSAFPQQGSFPQQGYDQQANWGGGYTQGWSQGFSQMMPQPYGGGFEGGASHHGGRRPGDWCCLNCKFWNYASRMECHKCHADREGKGGDPNAEPCDARRSGDWDCPSCQYVNYASRTECHRCQTSKDGTPSQNPPAQQRYNDWTCRNCNGLNYSRREYCYKCGAPKFPYMNPQFSPMMVQPPYGGGQNMRYSSMPRREGDWYCPHDGVMNYASRTECFKCHKPKPTME